MKNVIILLCLAASFVVDAKKIVLEDSTTVIINQPINEESTSKASLELTEKCIDGKDLYLFLNTPGGDIMAGLSFIDYVKSLDCKVHTISLYAASMGYIIMQALDNRYVLPNSTTIMSHRERVKLEGEVFGELDSRLTLIKRTSQRTDEMVSRRLKISVKKYRKQIANELWLVGQDAVARGHADKIVNVSCGKSMKGTKVIKESNMVMSIVTTYSKCPMLTYPIKIERKPIDKFFGVN